MESEDRMICHCCRMSESRIRSLAAKGIDAASIAPQVDCKFAGAFIRARKPGGLP